MNKQSNINKLCIFVIVLNYDIFCRKKRSAIVAYLQEFHAFAQT